MIASCLIHPPSRMKWGLFFQKRLNSLSLSLFRRRRRMNDPAALVRFTGHKI